MNPPRQPPRPCIERLPDGRGCPRYAEEGRPRCAEHHAQALKTGRRSPGTTAAWARARKLALSRAGKKCEKCGLTDAASRAAGLGGLHVHHVDGRGVRAASHDQALLQVLCPTCHRNLVRRSTRQTWPEAKAEMQARARQRP